MIIRPILPFVFFQLERVKVLELGTFDFLKAIVWLLASRIKYLPFAFSRKQALKPFKLLYCSLFNNLDWRVRFAIFLKGF